MGTAARTSQQQQHAQAGYALARSAPEAQLQPAQAVQSGFAELRQPCAGARWPGAWCIRLCWPARAWTTYAVTAGGLGVPLVLVVAHGCVAAHTVGELALFA
jgi:hypothetical protein